MRTPQMKRAMRAMALASVLLVAAACGDAPTAPAPLDAEDVARVLPTITDARVRLTPGIVDVTVRARVREELEQIELSLVRGNPRATTFRARVLRSVIADYVQTPGAATRADAADVTAIALALGEVAMLVGLPIDLALLTLE